MKIATLNINSIRARSDALMSWLSRVEPDVLCLQETKVTDDDFPTDELLRLGYEVAISGQKSYNGVAIAARQALRDVQIGLWDEPSPVEKRIIRATIEGVRVYSVYVPNGKSPDSPSFVQKLDFIRRLKKTLELEAPKHPDIVVCGDFNIAPDERDVFDPVAMQGRLHFHPEEHRALGELLEFGLVDVFRLHHREGKLFSWWDYRAGCFQRNEGLRIDFIFATRGIAERCIRADIDVEPRRGDKPSDHAPVVAEFV